MAGRKPISKSWSASSKMRESRTFMSRDNPWFSSKSRSLYGIRFKTSEKQCGRENKAVDTIKRMKLKN